ncbi:MULTISPECIES: PIN domain-containing protein [unclassified Aeromonas]|uniref:PIN domain-containing protein n=1 Tax=unclassified Aeromonas TaxID=257493 RepID=UPI0035283DFC
MLDELHRRYRTAGVMLDTNLLVMYLIGIYKKELVPQFKRTEKYTVDDFEFLEFYVGSFDKLIVTPHVLAETWNFVEKIPKHEYEAFLAKAIPCLEIFEEEYVDKGSIISSNGFSYIGVTDMAVIKAAKSKSCLVITDDLRAYVQFFEHGVETININHLRMV